MMTLLVLLVVLWFCRRAIFWLVPRAVAFSIGFVVGRRLVKRP